MAATVTEASAHLARNFARGQQKIYLPNHIITFIRPKPRQPPNMATFVVPLKFNKLDMRDYLFHVYGVKVQAVRSFVNQPAPDRRNGGDGRWYRPRSQKMMIAELVNPFVWPDPPAEGQREAFDFEIFSRIEKGRESDLSRRTIRAKGDIPLRELEPTSRDRKALRKQVREILAGGSGRDIGDDGSPSWTSNAEKGEKWVEVEENVKLP
ncbi:hypothetical protein B0T26DRAFT_739532 [Lasiosphaeria miniovina]|uniref:Large ribosomal subunit protein uL23m n=1 Tax=Lasiosphaeria miniovina TaxID=1954250 RepID=A0AA40AUN3_9PEZI|nr:uncharacterized protein B0T26DRAFT_739532 [Lasiosphaeria miniovina]KAK0722249.1 hypothetical protein B0T26DRAFT_739532 [Lasiosphaeria miniovina]